MSEKTIVLRSDAERTFLAKLAWIDRAALALCSRHGFDPDDKDDFVASVRQKLIEDDYATIRKHRGEASLETFLTTVIANHFRDYCVQRWGRWRPSAVALRAGPTAVRLEVLVQRDRTKLEHAIEVLRGEGVTLPASELRRLAMSFPQRSNPRKHERIPVDATSVDRAEDRVLEAERFGAYERAALAVGNAMKKLPPEDQLLLRLRIWEDLRISVIARTLGLEQKPLYRRIERLYNELRDQLEAGGVDAELVRSLLDEG